MTDTQSIAFFNQLDTLNTGKVTIQQMILACKQANEQNQSFDPRTSVVPNLIYELQQYAKLLTTQSIISLDDFLLYNNDFPELNATSEVFDMIDIDSDGYISFSELMNHYRTPPQPIITLSSGEIWLENLKQNEMLTDNTELTLDNFLSYQEKYNTTRYWPISN